MVVLAILKGGGRRGTKSFDSLKGGRKRFYPVPCLEDRVGGGGEAQTVSDPRFSHFPKNVPYCSEI